MNKTLTKALNALRLEVDGSIVDQLTDIIQDALSERPAQAPKEKVVIKVNGKWVLSKFKATVSQKENPRKFSEELVSFYSKIFSDEENEATVAIHTDNSIGWEKWNCMEIPEDKYCIKDGIAILKDEQVDDSSVTPPAKNPPENFGWITIKEGCEMPANNRNVPIKLDGKDKYVTAYRMGYAWYGPSGIYIPKPVAWYKVPPYQPEK